MAKIVQKSTVPYYACAAVWALYAAIFPLYKASRFVLVAVVSLVVFGVMSLLCKDVEIEVPDKPVEEKPTGNAELDAMLRDGKMALAEMERLNAAIQDAKISADIDRLVLVSGKIFAQVKADPSQLSAIRCFMDYYLPTTLKLLNAYDRMGAQGVSGENINATMQRVAAMMDTICAAFEKQLDSLFGAEAMDISTDITVLETMMAREGLTAQPLRADDAPSEPASGIELQL